MIEDILGEEMLKCEQMLVDLCNDFDPKVATSCMVSVIINSFIDNHKKKEDFFHVLTQAWDYYYTERKKKYLEGKNEGY